MKTSKQLAEQVIEKIQNRKRARRILKTRALKTGALATVCALLLPACVYFSITEKQKKRLPSSTPIEKEETSPFDETLPHSTKTQSVFLYR